MHANVIDTYYNILMYGYATISSANSNQFNEICELLLQLFVEIGDSHVMLANKNDDVCNGCNSRVCKQT